MIERFRSGRAYPWLCLLLFTIGFVISNIDRYLIAAVSVPLKTALQLSDTKLGLVQGFAFSLCYAVAAVPLAWWIDRGIRVRIAVGCVGVWSIGTALSGISTSFLTLTGARTLTAVSEAGFSPAALSLISDTFRRERVASATAIYMLAPSLGIGLSIAIGGALLGAFEHNGGLQVAGVGTFAPWQGVFLAMSIPGLILAGLTLLIVREPVRHDHLIPATAVPAGNGAPATPMRPLVMFLVPYVLGCTLVLLVLFTLAAWCPTFFVRRFGLTAAEAGRAIGPAVVGGGVLGPILASLLMLRGSAPTLVQRMPWTVAVAGVLAAAAVALMTGAGSSGMATAYLALAVASASTVSAMVVSPIQLLVPNRLRARTQAVSSFLFTVIAGGGGPSLVGFVTDRIFGERAIGSSLLGVCGPSGLCGAILVLVSLPALGTLLESMKAGSERLPADAAADDQHLAIAS